MINTIFSDKERELYEILYNIFNSSDFQTKTENKIFLFSKVRLVDFVIPWEGLFNEFQENSLDEDGKIRNKGKKEISDCICDLTFDIEIRSYIYKKLVFYPVLCKHVDFLICEKIEQKGHLNYKPRFIIEANGEEHDKDSEKRSLSTIENDEFKLELFDKKQA